MGAHLAMLFSSNCILLNRHRHNFNVFYNKVMVEGAAASRVFFHLKAEAVRMGE